MEEDIQDSEIRVIGNMPKQPAPQRPRRKRWAAIGVCVLLVGMGICVMLSRCGGKSTDSPFRFIAPPTAQPHPLRGWIEECERQSLCSPLIPSYTELKDTLVDTIPMRIYLPLNATPHIDVGYQMVRDTAHYILFFQAADVRADNGNIVGAFVRQGKPLSWGLSKQGYCAIIEGEVTIGVAANSPLFEEATEKGGDFFRQYPLVDNGRIADNELQTRSRRRGLCSVEGRVVVIESRTATTLHDFSAALIKLGVSDAIYLTAGAITQGYCRLKDNSHLKFGLWDERPYENASFIIW